MTEVIDLPSQIDYDCDQLEEWLLLQCLTVMVRDQSGSELRPALSIAARNDVLLEAQKLLMEPRKGDFLAYAERLWRALPQPLTSVFPIPQACIEDPSPAEALAHAFLCARTGSSWSALRQVTALLPIELAKRTFTIAQRSFLLGACGHRSFTGLRHSTRSYRAVCQLFNSFLMLINPRHIWTTFAVHLDFGADVHQDRQNGSNMPSMIVSLSHQWNLA